MNKFPQIFLQIIFHGNWNDEMMPNLLKSNHISKKYFSKRILLKPKLKKTIKEDFHVENTLKTYSVTLFNDEFK